jgi:hypothetical protein
VQQPLYLADRYPGVGHSRNCPNTNIANPPNIVYVAAARPQNISDYGVIVAGIEGLVIHI